MLHDGLGQGNNIANFPDVVHGAAAQLDLWRHSYSGLSLDAAIRKWSGGNSSPAYMAFLCSNTGMTTDTIVTKELLAGWKGLELMKAQAHWEAGKTYPMSDAQWAEAQKMVFPSATTVAPTPAPKGPSMTATTPVTPPPSILSTLSTVANKAETIVEDVARIEPTVAMFIPGSAAWQPFVLMAIPFIERALKDIAAQNGGDIFSAVIEIMQHLTPGQPNSSTLAKTTQASVGGAA